MIIPFGDWAPDKADLGNSATVAENVTPKASGTYGPFADLSAFSDAISARCQGAYAGVADDGGVSNFAADATKIYLLSGVTYGDVSRSAGYSTLSDEAVRFCQFGNRIISTNYSDPVQTYVLGSSSIFADLSSAAPRARHGAILDPGFLFLGNTVDSVDGAVPNRVWWSAYNDPTNFPTIGTAAAEAAQSDYNDLPYGGWVQAIVGAVGGASGLVLCDTAIYRVDYEGPPTIFRFTCIERARGTSAPNSVVNVGPFVAFLGPDGFYLNDGQQSRPIGAGEFDKSFYSDLNQNFLYRVYGAVDPINKLIIWVYPSINSYDGTCDSAILYSWESDRASKARFRCELVFRALSSSLTLENLDTLGFTMDTLPASLDSRAWTGGAILLAAFDTSHKYSIFGGSNLQATLETGEFSSNGQFTYVRGVRPLVDGGNPTVSIGHRDRQTQVITYTTATSVADDGSCPQHISTRYPRARVVIPAGDRWSHAIGVEPESEIEGGR